MTGIPFPEYALANISAAFNITQASTDILRTDWAGNGATGLLAEVLTMAVELDRGYARLEAALDPVSPADARRAEFLERAMYEPGLGSIFGLALDVSMYLHTIEDYQRDRYAGVDMPPSPAAMRRVIDIAQTEWLTETRDLFASILASLQTDLVGVAS